MMCNVLHTNAILHFREDKWSTAPHAFGVAFHHGEVRADGWGEVDFIDDEEVGLSDAGTAFAGDFVATGNINDLDGEIGEFAAEAGGQIVAAGFEEEDVGSELAVEIFEGEKVGRNVLANGGVRAPAGFDRANSLGGECVVADEEFAVFLCEDVVGDGGDAVLIAEMFAELEHEGGFAAADRAADANGEGALREITTERRVTFVKVAGMIEVLVSVAVVAVRMGMRMMVAHMI